MMHILTLGLNPYSNGIYSMRELTIEEKAKAYES